MSKPHSIVDALLEGPLVFDGAMGTMLYEHGLLYTSGLDAAVLRRPDLVRRVHDTYLEAGAQVLQSNTFGANRLRLAAHGLDQQVEEINRKAVELARSAIGEQGWVAGSVGPSGRMFRTADPQEWATIRDVFFEQCVPMVAAGVDALLLETFRQPQELRMALEAAKRAADGKVPIIASVSFDAHGTIADGSGPEQVAALLEDWGADVLGVNCADGPAGVYEMAVRMLSTRLPVVAQPNAGLPRRVEGRFAYVANPEYFQLYARRLFKAGIHGVGGCCGTRPEHIRKVAAAARMFAAGGLPSDPGGGTRDDSEEAVPQPAAPGVSVVETSDKGPLGQKVGREFIVSVEVNPPAGLSLESALQSARILRDGGVDVVNVGDGPRASARMGNLALCYRIEQEVQIPALMHVTTRDRNILGLVAHLIAAYELGVHNLVVITGDPPKMGDFPDATSVYDTDSIGLLRIIRGLNHGYDPGGRTMGGATRFLCATGAEPAARDFKREMVRLGDKCAAGAELVMTQPVYDPAVLSRFLDAAAPLDVPVLVGLLPLASHRNAEFLHNEVPGMAIPEDIRERMRKAGSGAPGRAEGVAIAREMLAAVKDRVAGAYIMPPFGRHELALRVIDGLVR